MATLGDKLMRVPLCPKCGGWMIWSFAIRSCEFVCVDCVHGEGMFNGCRKIEVAREDLQEYVKSKREKLDALYEMDLS
jgi:hypothetical protein